MDIFSQLKTISADIRSKNLSPYYYLYGNEFYFIEKILSNIKKSLNDKAGLNTRLYNQYNFNADEVIKYINNSPLMSDKKLIIFNDIDFFKRSDPKSDLASKVINSFEDSKDLNIIVIIEREQANNNKYNSHYNSSNVFASFAKEKGVLFNSERLSEEKLNQYIVDYFAKKNKTIDKVESAYIIKNCGNSITNLYNECDKIISYVDEETVIKRKHIDDCITKSIDDRVYKLIDLINNNRKNDALKFYGDLISESIPVEKIFSSFAYNYENLIIVKDYMNRGVSLSEIANNMGVELFKIRNMVDANKSTSLEMLNRKLKLVTDVSTKMMKGDLNSKYMVELLLN